MGRFIPFIAAAIGVIGIALVLILRGPGAAQAPAAEEAVQETRAEQCEARNAVYAYRGNPRLTMRLVTVSRYLTLPQALARDYDPGSLGHMEFVVVADQQKRYPFAALSTRGHAVHYLFPVAEDGRVVARSGLDLIQVSTFDTRWGYTSGLPIDTLAAPAHIYAPNMARHISALTANDEHPIDASISFFDFVFCDQRAAQ